MKAFVKLKISLQKDDISAIDKISGLKFDRTWVKGDTRPNSKVIEKFDGCILDSGLDDSISLEKHLEALLTRLIGVELIIKRLSERNTVDISCAIYSNDIPEFYFKSDIVSGIAKLGANFDIDYYSTEG